MPPDHRRQRHAHRVRRRSGAQADPARHRAGGALLIAPDASEGTVESPDTAALVWYAAYGSNLDPDRFGCYLLGGCPPGATRTYPGTRDRSPALGTKAFVMPGRLVFAWRSPTWGGAIAFYDPDADGEVLSTAYLLTPRMFSDVIEQEMRRDPGVDHDLSPVLTMRRHSLGPGRYETLHLTGELDGRPVLTFSATDLAALEPGEPAPAYLDTMSRGLRSVHGLTDAQINTYLSRRQ